MARHRPAVDMDAVFTDALRHAEVHDARYLIDLWDRAWAWVLNQQAMLERHAGAQRYWQWDMEIKLSLRQIMDGLVNLSLILDAHPDVERLP